MNIISKIFFKNSLSSISLKFFFFSLPFFCSQLYFQPCLFSITISRFHQWLVFPVELNFCCKTQRLLRWRVEWSFDELVNQVNYQYTQMWALLSNPGNYGCNFLSCPIYHSWIEKKMQLEFNGFFVEEPDFFKKCGYSWYMITWLHGPLKMRAMYTYFKADNENIRICPKCRIENFLLPFAPFLWCQYQ